MRQAADHSHDHPQASRRLSIQEAAEVLGVTVDAVRGRVKRGTLASTKSEDGSVYVLLEEGIGSDQSNSESQPSYDQSHNQPHNQSQLVERMASEIEFLRGELQRKDAILLSMSEGLKALEAPSEPRESPVTPSDSDGTEEAPPVQERRSWWRAFFGLE